MTPLVFRKLTENAEEINKLTICELDIIADMLKRCLPQITYKKAWIKVEKVNAVSKIIGDKTNFENKQRKQNGHVPSLNSMCVKILNSTKVRKDSLTTGYASYIFPGRLEKWKMLQFQLISG